jgi:hypothetical protein
VSVVDVGEYRNFYRCIAVHCDTGLQSIERGTFRRPKLTEDWTYEDKLTEGIRSQVMSLLQSSSVRSQLDEYHRGDQNRSPEKLSNRLREIEKRNVGPADPLEFQAVAFLAKTQIHVFEESENSYKLLAKYGHHAYSSRRPLTLLKKPRAENSEYFCVLIVNSSRTQQCVSTGGGSPLDALAHSATDEDRNVTFEQLLNPDRESSKQQTDSGDHYQFCN